MMRHPALVILLMSAAACTTSGVRVSTSVATGPMAHEVIDASLGLRRDQTLVQLLAEVSPS